MSRRGVFDRPRALVLTWMVIPIGCATNGPRPPEVVFRETPETESTSQIEFSYGPLSVSEAAVLALCRSAEVTLQRSFRYMLIYDRKQLGSDRSTWRLHLMHDPPAGVPVLDLDRPDWNGDPPLHGVIDADSLAAACAHTRSRPLSLPNRRARQAR